MAAVRILLDSKFEYIFLNRTFSIPPDGGTANSIFQIVKSIYIEKGIRSLVICENTEKQLDINETEMCTIISIPRSPFRPRELFLDYFTFYLKKINKFQVFGNAKHIISRHLYFSYSLSKLNISHTYILASFYGIETIEFLDRSENSFIKKIYLTSQSKMQQRIEQRVVTSKNLNIVVLSKMRSAELFLHYKVNSRVVYPGVASDYSTTKKTKFNYKILIHCRHEARKNLKQYFKEIENNKTIYEKIKIDVIGHGPETKHLINQINGSNFLKHRIKIHGFVNDIDPFYDNADLLIFPTVQEGFGQVVQEAMVRGVPVVCYKDVKTPFSEFIIDDKNGYLVNYYDESSISKKIKSIYQKPNDYLGVIDNLRGINFETWSNFIDKVTNIAEV